MDNLNLTNGLIVCSAIILAGTSLFLLSKFESGVNKANSTKMSSSSNKNRDKKSEKQQTQSNQVNLVAKAPVKKDASSSADLQYRGYKTTSDGKIRTYFHRELSAEDKMLLGDCTPQPITNGNIPSSAPVPIKLNASTMNSTKSQSQWNASGTWEERDHTKWAKDYLTNELRSVSFDFPLNQGVVTVSDVNSVEGDASVVMIRGKKKFIYDINIELTWKARIVNQNNANISGKFTISDVTSECMYDIKSSIPSYDITWTDRSRKLIDEYILSVNKGIKKAIVEALNEFLREFQALYDD